MSGFIFPFFFGPTSDGKKIVKNEFNLCCKGGDPRIYENSIFLAYVPEKNKNNNPVGTL